MPKNMPENNRSFFSVLKSFHPLHWIKLNASVVTVRCLTSYYCIWSASRVHNLSLFRPMKTMLIKITDDTQVNPDRSTNNQPIRMKSDYSGTPPIYNLKYTRQEALLLFKSIVAARFSSFFKLRGHSTLLQIFHASCSVPKYISSWINLECFVRLHYWPCVTVNKR